MTAPAIVAADVLAAGPVRRRVLVIGVLSAVSFLVVLDSLAVALALPAIGRDLGLSAIGLAWVVDGYSLALVGGLLLAGRIADVLGRRNVLVGGLVLLSAAAVACAFAASGPVLIAARVAQGSGAALCYPPALALLGDLFPEEPWRARAFAAGAVAGSAGTVGGAVFGGTVTGLLGWPWVFWLTVPAGLVFAAVARSVVPPPEAAAGPRRGLDLPGAVLAAGAGAALVLALTHLPRPDRVLLGALTSLPVLVGGWWAWERRRADPLVPPALYRSPGMRSGCAGIAANSALYSAVVFIGTLHLQRDLDLSATSAGLGFLPLSLAAAVAGGTIVSPLRRRLGSARTAIGGLVLGAAALAVLALLPTSAGYVPLVPSLVAIGVALTCAFVSFTADTIGSADPATRGTASAVFETSTHLAGAVSVAAYALVLAVGGHRAAYAVAAVLVLIGAWASASLRTVRSGGPVHAGMAIGRGSSQVDIGDQREVVGDA